MANNYKGPMIEDLLVYKSAKELRKYTFQITTNVTTFPKRYIKIISRIQDYVLDVPDIIYEANRDKENRQILGGKAIGRIDKLLSLIDLLYEINPNFGDRRANYWKSKASDVKYLTLAWIYPKRRN